MWNQQGSQVLRGQTLVLPVGDTFLYVDPIYIQATEARMPQLKKVVLAVGNRLIYADTYDEALAQLAAGSPRSPRPPRRPHPPPIPGWPASANISAATTSWPPKANGPKPARNWKPSKRKSNNKVQP